MSDQTPTYATVRPAGAERLSAAEQREVYWLTVGLHAMKRCAECRQMRPVVAFGGYGEPRCGRCRLAVPRVPVVGSMRA